MRVFYVYEHIHIHSSCIKLQLSYYTDYSWTLHVELLSVFYCLDSFHACALLPLKSKWWDSSTWEHAVDRSVFSAHHHCGSTWCNETTGGTEHSEAKREKPLCHFSSGFSLHLREKYLHCKTSDDSKISSTAPFSDPCLVTFGFLAGNSNDKKKVTSPATWGCHVVICYSVPLAIPLLLKCHGEKLQPGLIPSPLRRARRSKGAFLRMYKIKAVSKKCKFIHQVQSTSKQNQQDCIKSKDKSVKQNFTSSS